MLLCDATTARLAEEYVPDSSAVTLLDEHTARRHRVVPLSLDEQSGRLLLLTTDRFDKLTRELVQNALTRHVDIVCMCVDEVTVTACLDRCYRYALSIDRILLEIDQTDTATAVESELQLPFREPVVRLVDALLHEAVTLCATDIHLSPQREAILLRYRIDGVLHTVRHLPRECWAALLVRLKILADLDIANTRRPQDGHVARFIRGRRVDFRLGSFPLIHGENLVLRVLDRHAGPRRLAELDLADSQRDSLRALIRQPDGLILVVGPTGCGKSTTLYALLGERLHEGLNIMTLEDPVEYPVERVCQTSIDPARDLGFAQGVRGLLRQDPDVLLIGEVRDPDSCSMVLRAATSGHQVLTTLHASDSVSALARLIGLGAAPPTLAVTLRAIVAQRLLRLRCTDCLPGSSVPTANTAHCVDEVGGECPRCQGRGYYGRRVCLEILHVTPALARAIGEAADEDTLRALATREGLVTLRARAEQWVQQGHTTCSEVDRVLGPESVMGHLHRTGSVRDEDTGIHRG